MIIRYFFENSDEDYQRYKTLWDESLHRIVILADFDDDATNQQLLGIDIRENPNKDILGIRFPNKSWLENNEFFRRIKGIGEGRCEGIRYEDGNRVSMWIPSEIWIYNPL